MRRSPTLTAGSARALASGVAAAMAGGLLTSTAPLLAQEVSLSLVAADPAGGYDGAVSPDGRYLAVSSTRSGKSALWLFDRHTATWRQLTDDAGEDTEPAWSPDGQQLAFTSWREDGKHLWLLTLADGALRVLTPGDEEEEYAAWSADGQSIVYTGGPWKARNFYVLDVASGKRRALLDAPGHVGACSFHSDNRRVLCHTYGNGYGDLLSIDVSDGAQTPMTQANEWLYKPATDPAGRWLAYTRIRDEDEIQLAPMPASGELVSGAVTIAKGRWPVFARQGNELLFHRLVDEGSQVRLVDRDTGEFEVLVQADEKPEKATMTPDGRFVAYCARESDSPQVRVLDRRSGTRHALPVAHPACYPSYAPDGETLALALRIEGKWQVATVPSDGDGEVTVWTLDHEHLQDLDGPIVWSPDGQRLTFTSRTAPYESDLFVIDLRDGELTNVTNDDWYDEGPSFSADGDGLVFMSTRGGEWTWGLFHLSLKDGGISALTDPDYIEKGYPYAFDDGSHLWIETNTCLSSSFIAERDPKGTVTYHHGHAGARWASRSADAQSILFTISSRRTEYWVATLDDTGDDSAQNVARINQSSD
ncbi:MAG: hypothetical protein AAFX85_06740 [Pseudomonadota bacterium]